MGAAQVLMRIPLEGTSRWVTDHCLTADHRIVPDEDKFKMYIQIVRLLLEVSLFWAMWRNELTYSARNGVRRRPTTLVRLSSVTLRLTRRHCLPTDCLR